MEAWQVVFISTYGGALAWIIVTIIQQGKELAVMKSVLTEVNSKMNLFLKTEMDTLKELASRK